MTDINKLETIASEILNGNCMLFLGSGFSLGATNTLDSDLPSSDALANILDAETEYDSEGDLEEAAEKYEEKFGQEKLSQKLHDTFTVKTTSEEQEIICRNKWRRIYTTNYDNIVELITTKDGNKYLPVSLSSNPQDYLDKRKIVVHLNGSIYNIRDGIRSSEFKLTSTSYLTNSFLNSSWAKLFQFDIKDSDYIIFIGFSLKHDLDIKRILWEDSETHKKCIFIIKEDEKESNIQKFSRYGSVFPIGLKSFAEVIDKCKKTATLKIHNNNRPLLCFTEHSFKQNNSSKTQTITKIQDESIINLLLYGKVDDALVCQSIEHQKELPYYINRSKIDNIINLIENGAKDILIHSDMGNGKTMLIKGLSYILSNKNYNVYVFKKYYDNLNDEIERICSSNSSNTIIIVDNYNTNKKVIEAILTFRTKQILIVTERTVTNDLTFDWLREKSKKDFYEIDINHLDNGDISQCMSVLDNFGLWREYSTLNDFEKKEHLKIQCKSSIRLILLDIIKSTDIKNRISNDIKQIAAEPIAYEALVLMFVSNILNWNIDLDDISYALDNTIKGNRSFYRNTIIKEYVDFINSEIKVKSPILSEVILTEIMDVKRIRETLVKAFKNFSTNSSVSDYKKYMKTILSYASLQRIFNKEEGEDVFNYNIVQFFEDIRSCTFCERNPHYWLQYAIAKLGERKYDVAKLYFDNAYTFAKKISSFDTYQIDNHYARYLLENTINNEYDTETFKAFKQAHNILTDEDHEKEKKYYPFKVARLYYPFYEKFITKMSNDERKYFFKACDQIKRMIQKYKEAVPHSRIKFEVRQAEEIINKIPM